MALEFVVLHGVLQILFALCLRCGGLSVCFLCLHRLRPAISSMPVVRNFVEDARKIDYVREALLSDDRFKFPCSLDVDLNAALEWIAVRDPKQVYALPFICSLQFGCVGAQAAAERAETMRWIENMAVSLVQSGKCNEWFAGADPLIAKACTCLWALCSYCWMQARLCAGIMWSKWATVGGIGEGYWLS